MENPTLGVLQTPSTSPVLSRYWPEAESWRDFDATTIVNRLTGTVGVLVDPRTAKFVAVTDQGVLPLRLSLEQSVKPQQAMPEVIFLSAGFASHGNHEAMVDVRL